MSGLTSQEETALAMLRAGRSFEEASDSTHVDFKRLIELWKLETAPPKDTEGSAS
ncbi:hypothetical protein [Hyphomicrobium methylovorum]|uniref:hypothetical protein n=1 Tax=Hyphomicrobium methylovorum TaxID=84 RepID=UPI0015E71032|nr:hypothetical protein [Hyphomicrobium methylovorum]